MVLPCNEETRRHLSWVECPPDSGLPAQRTVICQEPDDNLNVKTSDAAVMPFILWVNYPVTQDEVKITIPKEATRFSIKFSSTKPFQFSFVENESGTLYDSVGHGGSYAEENLCLQEDLCIFVQAKGANKKFIVRYWTS